MLSDVSRKGVINLTQPITRDASFTPESVDGLVLRLDASEEFTISNANGFFRWSNIVGNGFDAIQPTEVSQPQTGIETQNGLNVLTFAGDFLYIPSTTLFPISGEHAFLIAYRQNSAATRILYPDSTTCGIRSRNNGNGTVMNTGGTGEQNITTSLDSGNFQVLSFRATGGGTAEVALGLGASQTPLFDTSVVSGGGANIGLFASSNGTQPLTGAVGEVLVYDTSVSDEDFSALKSYLIGKWGVS